MERTKPGRRVYNDCVPYGGRVHNHKKKEGMKLQKEQFDITGMTLSLIHICATLAAAAKFRGITLHNFFMHVIILMQKNGISVD